MTVVVVESPAKAKHINKYLGSGYEVLASYGHVRDLPPKDGSVAPDQDFHMIWQVDPKAQKRLSEIAHAMKKADKLILATDPDREGEAISWHVLEILKDQGALAGKKIERVVFNAITKQAVSEAMQNPREIDAALVDAYLARRALDYLVGFTLSPVLWRKLPGSRSAGRVQSVALRLVCDREREIETFVPKEYWSILATVATPRGETFDARLVGADGRKITRLDVQEWVISMQDRVSSTTVYDRFVVIRVFFNYLVREGVQRLLEPVSDVEVAAVCNDLDSLLDAVDAKRPDVVVTDIRMPPGNADEGIRAAERLRETHPDIGVVVLSQYANPSYALALLDRGSAGRAYLLKERLEDVDQLVGAIRAVAEGGSVIDAKVVEALVAESGRSDESPLNELTPRERDVLRGMAEGKNNAAIAETLFLTERSVEKVIHSIFLKLGLTWEPAVHRRVKAVILYLAKNG